MVLNLLHATGSRRLFAKNVVSLAASPEVQGSEFLINASNDLNAGTSARRERKADEQ